MAYEPGMDITHVHVTLNGAGQDIDFEHLDVAVHPSASDLKTAVERHLDLPEGTLRTYEADGYSVTGQVVLRPDAKLGADADESTDVRMKVMGSLLQCPHRDMDSILKLHKEMMDSDPEFYAHMAVWAQHNTKVRDHKEAFIACLFASEHEELREVGWVLLQNLPPYQVERIKTHIVGRWVTLNVRVKKDSKADVKAKAKAFNATKKAAIEAYEADKNANMDTFRAQVRTQFGLPRDAKVKVRFNRGRSKLRDKEGNLTGEVKTTTRVKFSYHRGGLLNNAPRVLQTAVKGYLRRLEADEKRLDNAAVRQFAALRGLYSSLHIKPSALADAILFKDNPPEGSKRHVMKQLPKIEDPVEWAKTVVSANIPFPVAVGLLGTELTPVHLIGLINQMTGQELLNNLDALKEKGALDNADVKALIDEKLGKAAKSNRVDALKAQKAAEVVGSKLDGATRAALENVADEQVKKVAKIKRATLLAIDASTSMQKAIDLAKEIGALIAPACTGTFLACSFNASARKHAINSDKKSDWDKALKFVKPIGKTNIGSVVQLVEHEGLAIEQFVLVTDEGDNGTPTFGVALERYRTNTGIEPNVVVVRCGDPRYVRDYVEKGCKHKGFEVDVFDMTGDKPDYYSLPNLLPLLAKGSRTELMMTIMDVPLPSRSEWETAHPVAAK